MCESPMDRGAPVMLAWATFKATEAYENAARWAVSPQDTEGSLWRAFLEGYTAAAPAPPADAATKAVREATRALRAEVEMMPIPGFNEPLSRIYSLAVALLSALSAPTPAPTAKEGRT